jgi:hypothetical protein
VDPFFGSGLLAYEYRLQPGELGFEINCHLRAPSETRVPQRAPQRLTTTVASRLGVTRLETRLWNDTKVTVELIDPVPHRPRTEFLPEVQSSTAGVLV